MLPLGSASLRGRTIDTAQRVSPSTIRHRRRPPDHADLGRIRAEGLALTSPRLAGLLPQSIRYRFGILSCRPSPRQLT